MQETWKDINGYEGMYQVSNFGNVKSLERKVRSEISVSGYRIKRERKLKPNLRNGYKNIQLLKNGVRKSVGIHRLVCEAFYRKIKPFEVINHLDYNPSNNVVWNLEIVTQKENVNYSKERMKKMRINKPHKTNTSEPYVSKRKNKESYRVTILKKEKTFTTISEAIKYRNEKLKELDILI